MPSRSILCHASPYHVISFCNNKQKIKHNNTEQCIIDHSVFVSVCVSLLSTLLSLCLLSMSMLTTCLFILEFVSVSVCFLFVPVSLVPSLWFPCSVVHFPCVMCAFPLVVPSLPFLFAMSCSFPLALVCWFLFVPFRVDVSFLCLGTFGC